MNKTGARFLKLKLVYKKAIQEMLNVDLEYSESTDSFYNSTINPVNYKEKIENLKNELSDLFKKKVKEYDLENKLNTLDILVKDNQETGDINNEEYIKEILESYLVEEKLELVEYVNNKTKELEENNKNLENELQKLESEYKNLNLECSSNEKRVNELIENMTNVYN